MMTYRHVNVLQTALYVFLDDGQNKARECCCDGVVANLWVRGGGGAYTIFLI